MVREAYTLLKSQLGSDIPIMIDHMGLDLSGSGSGTWADGKVIIGAWREDIDDPVWNVGGIQCGFDPSSTHFWNADAGDGASIDIPMDLGNSCPNPDGTIPNAYQKALAYYYGGWFLGYGGVSPWLRVQKPNGDWLRLIPLAPPGPVYFYYGNLAEVFRTKMLHTTFLWLAGMQNETTGENEWYDGWVVLPPDLIDKFVWEILGRIAHLMGDMSVPAHVHNDVHPCHVEVFPKIYEEGDFYELWMGGYQSSGPHCTGQPTTTVHGYDKTWQDALSQGGFINVVGKENPIRYLMYTTNQLADHFGSLCDNASPEFDPQRWYPGDNNYFTTFGGDTYTEFAQIMSTLGPPVTDMSEFPQSKETTSSSAYVYSIRAIAGLLYWFAREVGLISPPPLAPTLYSPGDGATAESVSPTLSWFASTGATSYRLQVATNSSFSPPLVVDQSDITATSYNVTGLANSTTYYWHVNASNSTGASPWSPTWQFTTVPLPPSAPSANPATNVTVSSFTANWTAVAGATTYLLDVSTDSYFDPPTVYNNMDVGNVTSRTVTGLAPGTRYYYRVRARNAGGSSPYSNTSSVTTVPSAPTLASPSNGATGVSTSPTLSWSTSTGATGYHLQVSTSPSFSSFTVNDSSLVTTSRQVGPLQYNTTY
jgi:hypothetical protein